MLAGTAILLYLVSGFVSFVIGGRLPRQCQLFSPRCCCSSARHRQRLKYVPHISFAVCLYRTPSLRVRCSRSPPLSVFLSRSLSLALLLQRGQCNCKIELFMAIVRQSIEIEIKCCCQRAAAASASASTVVVGFFCCCLWHVRTAIFQFFFPSPLPSVCRIYLFLFILTFWLGLACVRLELWFKVSVSGSIWQAIDCRNVPVCCLTHSILSLSLLHTVLLHLACCASHKPSQICRHFAWLLPLFGNGTICIWKCCMFNSCNILISCRGCCHCRCHSRCDSIRFALLFSIFFDFFVFHCEIYMFFQFLFYLNSLRRLEGSNRIYV